jgi:hypothetical protein
MSYKNSYTVFALVLNEHKPTSSASRAKACKVLAREHPAIAYRHTNQKTALGGREDPHIHLVVAVPAERAERWAAGAHSDLRKWDKKGCFSLSDPDEWVRNPDSLIALLQYNAGTNRTHQPEFTHCSKNWFQIEQELTGSASLHCQRWLLHRSA